jgi:hypothetical protein
VTCELVRVRKPKVEEIEVRWHLRLFRSDPMVASFEHPMARYGSKRTDSASMHTFGELSPVHGRQPTAEYRPRVGGKAQPFMSEQMLWYRSDGDVRGANAPCAQHQTPSILCRARHRAD